MDTATVAIVIVGVILYVAISPLKDMLLQIRDLSRRRAFEDELSAMKDKIDDLSEKVHDIWYNTRSELDKDDLKCENARELTLEDVRRFDKKTVYRLMEQVWDIGVEVTEGTVREPPL